MELKPAHIVVLKTGDDSKSLLVVRELAKALGAVLYEEKTPVPSPSKKPWSYEDIAPLIVLSKKALRELLRREKCSKIYAIAPIDASFFAAVFAATISGLLEGEAKRVTLRVYSIVNREKIVAEASGEAIICPRTQFHTSFSPNDDLWKVLRALVEETIENRRPIGPTELSKKLGLPKSTVHRKLQSLVNLGFAKRVSSTTARGDRGLYTATERGIACS